MDLEKYFEGTKGRGVLATADSEGRVDVAIYAKPHFVDAETVAFIMADRLTHHHLNSNPHAAYLFWEDGKGYKGIRLFLTKMKEEKDSDLLYSIRSKKYPAEREEGKPRFLVFFKVDKTLPLIGAGKDAEEDE